jgi:choline-sulfatase
MPGVGPHPPFNQRALLCGIAALLLLATAYLLVWNKVGVSESGRSRSGVNVLLISIDSLRADHLYSYGYYRETSPNLDRLAAGGALFETMVADSSWTLPSHMTLLTGLSSRVHGVVLDDRRLDPARITLAELLRRQGYRTEAFVSADYVHPVFGFDQGFERYAVLGDSIYDEAGFSMEKLQLDPEWQTRFEKHEGASHRTQFSDELSELVRDALVRLAGEPFFLFVHMFDVHYDYNPPEEYWRKFSPDYRGDFDPVGYASNPRVHRDMAREDLEQVRTLYDGEILWTDTHIGIMLDALADAGLEDHTLVVVIGDHGEEFFEHGFKGHRKTLFDEQLLVPFILRLPEVIPAGRRLRMQARMIDVMPTILDIAGLEVPDEAMGESLLPYVRAELPEADLPAVSYLFRPGRYELTALRHPGSKLLQIRKLKAEQRVKWGHYDLARQPAEDRAELSGPAFERAFAELDELLSQEDVLRARLETGSDNSVSLPASMRESLESLGYVE